MKKVMHENSFFLTWQPSVVLIGGAERNALSTLSFFAQKSVTELLATSV